MKRFRELIAAIRTAYPADGFFAEFEKNIRVAARRKAYRYYNDALMLLDDESWKILKAKAVEQYGNEREGQTKQPFFNQLNEAFAYRYLLRRKFTNIRFLEEGKKRTPDIRFFDQERELYCEVKSIGISQDEIKRRNGGVHDGRVYLNVNEGLINKLKSDIDGARKQIQSVGKDGIVFMAVRFDDWVLHHYENYRKQLIEFCRSGGYKDVVIKVLPMYVRRLGLIDCTRMKSIP